MHVSRFHYYRRIFSAYFGTRPSQLTFWHDTPALNPQAEMESLGEYYMPFSEKANYAGPFDSGNVPLIDYRGHIGLQYNPIAIAQWGLGNYNLFVREGSDACKAKFLAASDWLCDNLEKN